jgi:hypothetical protein
VLTPDVTVKGLAVVESERVVIKFHKVEPLLVGVAHVLSPRQNVELDADVPLFKCDTPRLPVTYDDKSIAVPFHTPVAIVPSVVIDDWPTYDADISTIKDPLLG